MNMTFSQFSQLPAELRFKVFRCCSKKDLLNVALASKQCRDEVLPYRWVSLNLSWHRLERTIDVKKFEQHLKHTKKLEFDDNWQLRKCLDQGYKSFAFHNILRFCKPDKLRMLVFRKFMIAGGLQVASELLPAISYLNLDWIVGVRHLWGSICSFRHLQVLRISRCDISDGAFKDIEKLVTLRKLFVNHCRKLTGSCLLSFNKVATWLTAFEFAGNHDIPGFEYENLSDLENIKSLSLYGTNVDDEVFMQLNGKLKYITDLDVSSTPVTDLAMPAISSFVSLKELNLYDCGITDVGVEHVVKLNNLTRLNLPSCNITDIGLALISKMIKLTYLDISSNTEVTDQGLVHIMSLPLLTSLEICGCTSLTNATLELISKRMLQLEYINVTGCDKFTIDGLNHLLVLPHLRDVDYDGDSISQEDFNTFYSRL